SSTTWKSSRRPIGLSILGPRAATRGASWSSPDRRSGWRRPPPATLANSSPRTLAAPPRRSSGSVPKRDVIIDTDPGIDDALAILLALASPEIELRALTTVAGNVRLELTTQNALKLCELGGRPDLPVYAGCDQPMARSLITGQVHGTTGMDGASLASPKAREQDRHAVDWLIETLTAAPPVSQTLVPIGPLTNIATALNRAPGIARALRDVGIMAGATPK